MGKLIKSCQLISIQIIFSFIVFVSTACQVPAEKSPATEDELQHLNQTIERLLILNLKNRKTQDDLRLLYDFTSNGVAHVDYTKALLSLLGRGIPPELEGKQSSFLRQHPEVTFDALMDIFDTYFSSDKTKQFSYMMESETIFYINNTITDLFREYWKEYPDKRFRIAQFVESFFIDYMNMPANEELLKDEKYLYEQFAAMEASHGERIMIHFIENLPEEEIDALLSREAKDRIEFTKKLYDRLETYRKEKEWREYLDMESDNGDEEQND